MSVFPMKLDSLRWMSRLAMLAVAGSLVCGITQAQTKTELVSPDTTSPYASFEYGTLTGTQNALTASWVPVFNGTKTVYENITLTFNVDSSGNVTVATITTTQPPAPLISSFEAGTYVGPSNDTNFTITVSGPGVTKAGYTEWTSSLPSGASYYTYPASATWYVGPLASSPMAARVAAAKIPTSVSNNMYFGIESASCGCNTWGTDTLVGVSQVGNSITFFSFTQNETDHAEPVDQITYTLQSQQ